MSTRLENAIRFANALYGQDNPVWSMTDSIGDPVSVSFTESPEGRRVVLLSENLDAPDGSIPVTLTLTDEQVNKLVGLLTEAQTA